MLVLDSVADIQMGTLENDSDVDVVGLDADVQDIEISSHAGVGLNSNNRRKVTKITVRGFVSSGQLKLLPKCSVLFCPCLINLYLLFILLFFVFVFVVVSVLYVLLILVTAARDILDTKYTSVFLSLSV